MKRLLLIISLSAFFSQDTTYISLPDAFINQLYHNSDIEVNQDCNGCPCPVGEFMYDTQIISYPSWLDSTYISFSPDTSGYYYYGGSYQLIIEGTPAAENIGNEVLTLYEYVSYDYWYEDYDNITWEFTDVYIIDLNIKQECIDFTDFDFGECAMVLGVGFTNGQCNYISGCSWVLDDIDYSDLFFDSIEECEETCNMGNSTELGDINNDGSVNVLDAIDVVSLILNGEYSEIVDMNYDGIVNVLDIIEIIYIIID